MNTKLIMVLSAIVLAVIGISLTFLPNEISGNFDIINTNVYQLTLQILGALYFSFAMLNWMAKGSIIGGIYNRPIAIANFAHFLIGALALIKGIPNNSELHYGIWVLAGLYSVFAMLFGLILFRHPGTEKISG